MMIKLVNIHKLYETEYGGFLALRDINLDFSRQEFVCVLGKSGSGKTTLLNIIGGLDKPSAGHMVIDGQLTTKFTEQQWDYFRNYKIGFVFQNYSLIEHLTVLDNVMLSLRLQGVKQQEAREKAMALLERVGVGDQANKLPKHLSGGQRQRVAIARALINDPEIILADEPTGSLDKRNSKEVLDLLKELSQEKLVIMVTHNRRLAKQYADRIIELKDGQVVRDTRPEAIEKVLIRKPEKLYTTFRFIDKVKHGLKNLRMKKVRTFLTALGLSIGVIGYILINALSNGLHVAIIRQRHAFDKDPDFTLTYETDHVLGYKDPKIDELITQLLKDRRIKTAYLANNSTFYMTGIDDEEFAYYSPIKLLYPYVDDPNEKPRYLGRIYGDGRWPENENEIAITLDIAKRLFDYSNIETLWSRLKGRELYITTDFYYHGVPEPQYGCVFYDFIDEETAPEEYDEEAFGPYLEQIEIQKSMFGKPLIEEYYYDPFTEEEKHFIAICEDYYRIPLQRGKVKETKPFKIVGIIESNHVSHSIITEEAYKNLFYAPIYTIRMVEDKEQLIYEITFNLFVNDELDEYERAQFKSEMSQWGRINEYSDGLGFDIDPAGFLINLVTFVMNVIMIVSVITAGLMLLMVLSISVMERTREIGILRSLGATKQDILSIFTVESGLIGLFGGILGILLSYIVAFGANLFIRHYYADWLMEVFNRTDLNLFIVKPGYAIIAAFVCTIFAVLFGLFPALQASRKSPINALRRLNQS